jgi:hypothetical protein
MNGASGLEFTLALLFGAVGVWFHAWNQFNRASYAQSPEFARLLSKLQPSDLRSGRVFIQSFVIYVSILTIVYLALCAFLTVPALAGLISQIPGVDLLGGTAGANKLPDPISVAGVAFAEDGGFAPLGLVDTSGPSTSIPLAVSLAVVGLAPNIPWLARFEQLVRSTAHRLSGIPTQLINSTLTLRSDPLIPDDVKTGLLLSSSDWARITAYGQAAEAAGVAFKEEFVRDIRNIIALRLWVLEGAVGLRDNSVRSNYLSIEDEVQARITALIQALDAKSGHNTSGAETSQNDKPGRDWVSLVLETEETLEDLCLLILLYSEHRAVFRNAGTLSQTEADPERKKASYFLFTGVQRASGLSDEDNAGSMLFFRLTGAIIIVAAVTGAIVYSPGPEAVSTAWGWLVNVMTFVVSAVATYVVALFFVLSFHQTASQRSGRGAGWANAFAGNANVSRAVPQLVLLFLLSIIIALLIRIAFHLFYLASTVGFQPIRDNFARVLDYAVKIELMHAVLGGILALSTVLMLDAWRAGRLPRLKWWFLLLVPLVLGLTQLLGAQAINALGGTMNFGDLLRLVRYALSPVAIGLVVVVYALRSLSDEFPATYRGGAAHA